MSYLYQKVLVWVEYRPKTERPKKDQCSFCGEKINERYGNAYATLDHRNWVCAICYGDFRDMFKWKLDRQ